ncbi:GINS complex subunit 1 [Heterostelium album PN500]|uniref:DNA replication complex GINS protein PSF1 n=1 Tax=Heterostelium pallidum (strain ATCC 26659 / Pp 5 / PN500) TaxID=670386 RepID=D3BKQ3_HETP5|nr:GINS complex subunit 1 [Heterostelium album PN500]EFA78483.1 GINS complex subunit 1 [Heterostelium album PN500]|eukprot:XP_020430607.1 GINS complex subunit 1 [Heterostelium album PN500]
MIISNSMSGNSPKNLLEYIISKIPPSWIPTIYPVMGRYLKTPLERYYRKLNENIDLMESPVKWTPGPPKDSEAKKLVKYSMNKHKNCENSTIPVKINNSTMVVDFNEDAIKKTIDEINALKRELLETIEENEETKNTPYIIAHSQVFHNSILRNKRIILAYLNERLERIKEYRWNSGSGILQPQLKESMSPNEVNFFTQHDKLLTEYHQELGLDLTMDVLQPPKELFIEVRVIKEFGEVVLASGSSVQFKLHTTHFLRRSDVGNLITQGILEHISHLMLSEKQKTN